MVRRWANTEDGNQQSLVPSRTRWWTLYLGVVFDVWSRKKDILLFSCEMKSWKNANYHVVIRSINHTEIPRKREGLWKVWGQICRKVSLNFQEIWVKPSVCNKASKQVSISRFLPLLKVCTALICQATVLWFSVPLWSLQFIRWKSLPGKTLRERLPWTRQNRSQAPSSISNKSILAGLHGDLQMLIQKGNLQKMNSPLRNKERLYAKHLLDSCYKKIMIH